MIYKGQTVGIITVAPPILPTKCYRHLKRLTKINMNLAVISSARCVLINTSHRTYDWAVEPLLKGNVPVFSFYTPTGPEQRMLPRPKLLQKTTIVGTVEEFPFGGIEDPADELLDRAIGKHLVNSADLFEDQPFGALNRAVPDGIEWYKLILGTTMRILHNCDFALVINLAGHGGVRQKRIIQSAAIENAIWLAKEWGPVPTVQRIHLPIDFNNIYLRRKEVETAKRLDRQTNNGFKHFGLKGLNKLIQVDKDKIP